MRKATATYNAPEGDNKVVEMGGVTFFDGQPVELNTDDHGHMISKFENNPHFDVEVGEDDGSKTKKRGRRSVKENLAEATGHDFEADRQNTTKDAEQVADEQDPG